MTNQPFTTTTFTLDEVKLFIADERGYDLGFLNDVLTEEFLSDGSFGEANNFTDNDIEALCEFLAEIAEY